MTVPVGRYSAGDSDAPNMEESPNMTTINPEDLPAQVVLYAETRGEA